MKKAMILFIVSIFSTVLMAQDQTVNGNLHLIGSKGSGIRIGKIGDVGTKKVPVGAVTAQYNLDFSGYCDIVPDQI